MKWVIFFIILFSTESYAKYQEFNFSLLNGHIFARNKDFKNKIDSKGILMHNPWFSYRFKNFGLTIGKDSVNSTIYGGFLQGSLKGFKVYDNEGWHWIAGAYSFSEQDWRDAQVINNIGNELNFMPYAGLLWKKKVSENVTINVVITLLVFQINIGYLF